MSKIRFYEYGIICIRNKSLKPPVDKGQWLNDIVILFSQFSKIWSITISKEPFEKLTIINPAPINNKVNHTKLHGANSFYPSEKELINFEKKYTHREKPAWWFHFEFIKLNAGNKCKRECVLINLNKSRIFNNVSVNYFIWLRIYYLSSIKWL